MADLRLTDLGYSESNIIIASSVTPFFLRMMINLSLVNFIHVSHTVLCPNFDLPYPFTFISLQILSLLFNLVLAKAVSREARRKKKKRAIF